MPVWMAGQKMLPAGETSRTARMRGEAFRAGHLNLEWMPHPICRWRKTPSYALVRPGGCRLRPRRWRRLPLLHLLLLLLVFLL